MGDIDRGKQDLYNRLIVRFVKGLNVVAVAAVFAVCWYLYYSQRIISPFYRRGNYVVIALFAVIYYLIAHLYHGYLLHLQRISELTYSQTMAAFCADGIMYVVMGLLGKHLPNILPYILMFAAQMWVIVFWCKHAHHWYLKNHKPKKTAIIWEEREHLEPLIKKYGMDTHFDIVKVPAAKDAVKDIDGCLKDVEVVFLNGVHSSERNIILKECIEKEIPAYVSPGVADVIMTGADRLHLFHQPFLFVHGYDPTPEYLFIKRLMDIILSLIALILLSPVMIVVAIIIKSDGGTAFYKQTRLTQYGREFQVLKFRSMRMDAEKDGVARLSSGDNDPRITPIGRFIRKVRIECSVIIRQTHKNLDFTRVLPVLSNFFFSSNKLFLIPNQKLAAS